MAYLGLSGAVTQFSPLKTLSHKYQQISWFERLIALFSIVALVAMVAWRLDYNPLYGVGGAAALCAFLHVILTYSGWGTLLVVWLLNIVSIPVSAQAYSLSSDSANDFAFAYVTSVVALFLSSALWAIIAARFAPGRLWITLLLVFVMQNFIGGVVAIWLNTNLSIFIAVVMGGIAVGIRALANRKNTPGTLQPIDSNEAKKFIDRFSKTQLKPILTQANTIPKTVSATAIAESTRGLHVFYAFKTTSPLTLKNGRLRHEGKYLEDFFAPLIVESLDIAHVAKSSDAHTIILVKDRFLAKEALKVNLSTSQGTKVGTAVVAHPDHLNEALVTLEKLKLNPQARELIRTKYARKSNGTNDSE